MFDYSPSFSPERNLLVAVLRRALFDYCNGSSAERSAAEEWFLDDDSEASFSFQWICTQLSIEPASILQRLRAGGTFCGNSFSMAM